MIWAGLRGEWRLLFGGFDSEGVSVEWHDFECEHGFDWARTFHPESLEICVNLEGRGSLRRGNSKPVPVTPGSILHYSADAQRLEAEREGRQKHRFLTVEMSRPWLQKTMEGHEGSLHGTVRRFMDGKSKRAGPRELPLPVAVGESVKQMLRPPVAGDAGKLWFHSKILEIAAYTLTEQKAELFCKRHQRLAEERVERVKQILAQDLEYPPTLAELGRQVGCSPFYLSRIFSEHAGMTISRYLRNCRLERAAELMRDGKSNVTEASMAVGYSSLSHFSKAFAEFFGVCPCVYSLRK